MYDRQHFQPFAGTPQITDIDALLGAVDGILLTGGRANVHPTHFGVEPHPSHEPYDQDRDAMARLAEETLWKLLGGKQRFREVDVRLVRSDRVDPQSIIDTAAAAGLRLIARAAAL